MANPEIVTTQDHRPVSEMTDRELLEEIVTDMRTVADALDALADHPTVKALMTGANPMAILMGRA